MKVFFYATMFILWQYVVVEWWNDVSFQQITDSNPEKL